MIDMASTSYSLASSFSSSSTFIGSKVILNEIHSKPTRVKFHPLRISAAACTSTAERTRTHHVASSPGSLYEVLGIQMGATFSEIKAAYRRLARVLHPDVATINGQNENTAYEFMKVHEAYETLSDPVKRADYDRTLFRRRRPLSTQFSISGLATTMANSPRTDTRFSGYGTRRTWETDQCW